MKCNMRIRDRVLSALRSADLGLNIAQTANSSSTTKITAKKHLLRLCQEGLVREFLVGRMRFFIIKKEV